MAGFEEALDLLADDVGLASAGGELGEEAAFAEGAGAVDGAQAVLLVVAELAGLALALVELGDGDGGEGGALAAQVAKALEVAARKEGCDAMGVGEGVVPEVDLLAVGEKDEGRVEVLGVGERLVFGSVGIDAFFLASTTASGRPCWSRRT